MRLRHFLFTLAVALPGLLPLFGLLYLTHRQCVADSEAAMRALSEATAKRANRIFSETKRNLQRLEREGAGRGDKAAVKAMGLVVFTDPFIKEVGLVRRGMLVATDQGVFAAPGKDVGKKHPMHLHAPPPGEIEILPPVETIRPGRSVIVKYGIGDDCYLNALIDPEVFTEFHRYLDAGEASEVFLVRHDGTPLISFAGEIADGEVPTGLRPGVSHHAGRLLAVHGADDFPVYVVVAASSEHLLRGWRRNALLFVGIGLFGSILAAFLGARAARRLLGPERELGEAISSGELELHYQPIVDLETGRCVGAEALVRWRHPHRGLIPPLQFIPLAEETGLIAPLTDWVIMRAAAEFGPLLARRPDLRLSLNVSGHHFTAGRAAVAAVVFGHASRQVVFELTEHMLAGDRCAAEVGRVKASGVRLAIDDFGTGYSNLAYLQRFPIDYLKIDKSFVDGLVGGEDTSGLIEVILYVGRALKLEPIAEGVERADQAVWLKARGVRWAQGWLFSKALPLAAFLPYLESHERKAEDAPRPGQEFIPAGIEARREESAGG